MATDLWATCIMRKVLVFACVLCVDIIIVYTLDLGGALLKSRSRNLDYNLFRQWAESALRCTLLYAGSVLYKDATDPLIRRWITVHSQPAMTCGAQMRASWAANVGPIMGLHPGSTLGPAVEAQTY